MFDRRSILKALVGGASLPAVAVPKLSTPPQADVVALFQCVVCEKTYTGPDGARKCMAAHAEQERMLASWSSDPKRPVDLPTQFLRRSEMFFTLKVMHTCLGEAWWGRDIPKVISTTNAIWHAVWNATAPNGRYFSHGPLGSKGWQAMQFLSSELVVDRFLPEGQIWFINPEKRHIAKYNVLLEISHPV